MDIYYDGEHFKTKDGWQICEKETANYIWRKDEEWKAIQRVQAQIPKLAKGVNTVPCADICEEDDIHPPSKRALSERIVDSF